jgi:hypothetical protein
MSVNNSRSKGRCCAGRFCQYETMELCVAHKCITCKNGVHVLCGQQNLETDQVECFACINKAKQSTTTTTNITGSSTILAAATTLKKAAASKKKVAKLCKKRTHQRGYTKWEKDSKNGPDDPNDSIKILLDWMTDHGNYNNYCSGNKTQTAKNIADMINAKVLVPRNDKQVRSKIEYLEGRFKTFDKLVNNTGADEQLNNPGGFSAIVMKKFPYYYKLYPIMKDQWITHPPVTSLTRDAMITGILPQNLPPPPPAISFASIANGNSGLVSNPSDMISPLTSASEHTNNTNLQQNKAADKHNSMSSFIDMTKVKDFMATYEQNDNHTGMMQQYKETKEQMELDNFVKKLKDDVEKRKDEKVMRDIMLYKEYMQLIGSGTSEEFIQQHFPSLVKFFPKKSSLTIAPDNSTSTHRVRYDNSNHGKWKWIGVTREWINAHKPTPATQNHNTDCAAESYEDLDTDGGEDCDEFVSDDSFANVEEATADDNCAKNNTLQKLM